MEETPVYDATSKRKIAGGISSGLTRTKTFHTNYSLKNAKMMNAKISLKESEVTEERYEQHEQI